MADGDVLDNFIRAAIAWVPWTRSTMLVHRDVFRRSGLFDEGLTSGEDLDLCLRIAYHWGQVGFATRPMGVYFGQRPGSLAGRGMGKRMALGN